MSEFYELKQRKPVPKHNDVDYWKARCKESEKQVMELNQALTVSFETISLLEATLKAVDKFLKKLGIMGKDGKSVFDAILTTGVSLSFAKGRKPKVDLIFDETYEKPAEQLKRLEGLDINATLLSGVNIWPRYKNED